MGWIERIRKAFQVRQPNYGGTSALAYPWLGGTRYDYVREAGDLWANSPVSICINKKAGMMADLTLRVERWDERTGKWVPHSDERTRRLLRTFRKPNDFYGFREILWATILNDDCRGHSILYKRRNEIGQVVGYWVLPYTKVSLESDTDNSGGTRLITYVRYYTPGGAQHDIPWSDCVMTRQGLDPSDQRSGLSPLAAQLREVCTDNNASNKMAALLQNGPTGFIVSPKASDKGPSLTVDQLKAVGSAINNMARDRAGKTIPLAYPVDITPTDFKPSEMDLGNIRAVPMDRICAALGGDPMAFGLPSTSKTYSNLEEALDALGNQTIIPTANRFAEQWGEVLLPDFGLDTDMFRLAWSHEGVSWLADETMERHEDARKSFIAGITDRYQAKIGVGVEPAESDKGVTYFDLQARARGVLARADSERKETPKALMIAWGRLNKNRRPPIEAKRAANTSQLTHDRLIREMERRGMDVFSQFNAGAIDADKLQRELNEIIYDVHRSMYRLGIQSAGGTPTDAALDQFARIAVDGQQQYLLNFIGDVQTGRYDDDNGAIDLDGSLKTRWGLYATNASGSASFGFVEGSPANSFFDWQIDAAAENCEDCIALSDLGPYPKELVGAVPRSGETVCLGNCKCRLIRSDGIPGFGP